MRTRGWISCGGASAARPGSEAGRARVGPMRVAGSGWARIRRAAAWRRQEKIRRGEGRVGKGNNNGGVEGYLKAEAEARWAPQEEGDYGDVAGCGGFYVWIRGLF